MTLHVSRLLRSAPRSSRTVCFLSSEAVRSWQLRQLFHPLLQTRPASSKSSSSRWTARQSTDAFAREAKVAGLKSRAAFKLLQINEKHRIFRPGQTVVDLGYAPGSWSQVAANRCHPHGRIIGVDVLPVQPPRGVSTIQGSFLSPEIQAEVRSFVADTKTARTRPERIDGIDGEEHGYIDRSHEDDGHHSSTEDGELAKQRCVDVVLSDMCAPWHQTAGFSARSLTEPYRRMQNTSGTPFRDHAGSMDLCAAALSFAYDTLKPGGHFVCKFYQGGEDRVLEGRLRRLFERVVRDKPAASRSESKEGYFVGLRRKGAPSREEVFAE